jgi:fumarate reductase flavoprotein subunit
MWDYAGIIRTRTLLDRAASMLGDMKGELEQTGIADTSRAFNLTWSDWLNLDSQILVSKVITAAAAKRENTRGSHCRDDFKEPGDLATSRFTVVRLTGDLIDVTDEAVKFTIVEPGETLLKDKAAAESCR